MHRNTSYQIGKYVVFVAKNQRLPLSAIGGHRRLPRRDKLVALLRRVVSASAWTGLAAARESC